MDKELQAKIARFQAYQEARKLEKLEAEKYGDRGTASRKEKIFAIKYRVDFYKRVTNGL